METSRVLHRGGISTSYSNIRLLTSAWADAVTMEHATIVQPGLVKGRAVHIIFDNA